MNLMRRSPPRGAKRQRAYAIGDVHGCLDLLEQLLARIEDDLDDAPARTSIVFLGDLIDRGPSSAQLIERLRTYSARRTTPYFVMGNHEEIMLRVLDGDRELLDRWLKFGGAETLRSYGVDPAVLPGMRSAEFIDILNRAVPRSHVEFLRSFTDSIAFGEYLFVHAGIRPGLELAQQSQSDLHWIREPFLGDESDHGFVVVHGHTISNEVEIMPNRIGIDTGAYCTGTLTALAIEESKRWLLQTGRGQSQRVPLSG